MEKWNKNGEDGHGAKSTVSMCESIAISPFTSNASQITHHASSFHVSLVMYLVSLFLVFTLPISVVAENSSSDLDVKAIIKKIDELYRSESSYAEVEMQIRTPHWERTLALELWTKGMDKTFIAITSPKKEKGMATLRIKTEMWNYLPKTDKVIKIPPSMMMGSWMGSDFTNDDLVKESSMLDDYHYQLITPEGAQADLLYLELTPQEDSPIVWGKIVVAVKESDYMPVWYKYYDEKGQLMRVMNLKEIRQFDGRRIPSLMEMVPQNKEGHKTVVRYVNAEFDSQVNDNIFTRRNLRKKR